jgi:hypothetical protein
VNSRIESDRTAAIYERDRTTRTNGLTVLEWSLPTTTAKVLSNKW